MYLCAYNMEQKKVFKLEIMCAQDLNEANTSISILFFIKKM